MRWLLQLVLGNETSVVAIVSLMHMILIIVTLIIVYGIIVVIIDVITIPLPFDVITIPLPFGCFVGAGNSGHGFSFLSNSGRIAFSWVTVSTANPSLNYHP